MYRRSVEIKRTASVSADLTIGEWCSQQLARHCLIWGLHTTTQVRSELTGSSLTLTFRSSEEFLEAIKAWEESIHLQPSSPDAHTSTFPIITRFIVLLNDGDPRFGKRLYNVTHFEARPGFEAPEVSFSTLRKGFGVVNTADQGLHLLCLLTIQKSLSI